MDEWTDIFIMPSKFVAYKRTESNAVVYFSELWVRIQEQLEPTLQLAHEATCKSVTPFAISPTFITAWEQGWEQGGLEIVGRYAVDGRVDSLAVLTLQSLLLCGDRILSVDMIWGRTVEAREALAANIRALALHLEFVHQLRWDSNVLEEVPRGH